MSKYNDKYVAGLELDVIQLREQLAKANERVKELEDTVHLLEKDLLRQSVFMINTAAKLEQHREWQATANVLRRPTREANEALNKFAIGQQIEAFEKAQIPKHAKAGCIGEFNFTIEDGVCCPECWWNEQSDDCHMCNGNSDESGLSDLTATVPWDLCKSIWLRMNKIYAEQLRKEQE